MSLVHDAPGGKPEWIDDNPTVAAIEFAPRASRVRPGRAAVSLQRRSDLGEGHALARGVSAKALTMVLEAEPRVSVCVPTINRPRQFRETLQSIDGQTFRQFEIVVADNSGKPENQRAIDEVLTEFKHLPIRLLRHPKNLEVATNFNSMLDASRGEFWACLPDDDRYCPTFLARGVAALDANPECSFTFADHWITDRREHQRSAERRQFDDLRAGRSSGRRHRIQKICSGQSWTNRLASRPHSFDDRQSIDSDSFQECSPWISRCICA